MSITTFRPLAAPLAAAALAIAACQEPAGLREPASAPLFSTSYGAELLECPSSVAHVAVATVDPLGGTVSTAGSSITIPAGALLAPTQITLSVEPSNYLEVSITAGGEEHFVFEAPVTVTIGYSRCTRSNIDEEPLGAWYIDGETDSLIEPMSASDDKVAKKVTFQTGHLSSYAVAH
jgi:hypothetical protein